MLKKTIEFENLEGEKITEECYFHLNKSEIVELELSYPEGYTGHLEKVIQENNRSEIVKVFKDLIKRSYGVRSDDGKSFIKDEEVTKRFMYSDAYSELFLEIISDPEKNDAFVTGIMPKSLVEEARKQGLLDPDKRDAAVSKFHN